MEEEYTEESTEETEAADESGEVEESETQDGEVEYQVDEDGEQILDDDGNPIPVEVEGDEAAEKGNTDHKKNAQDRIQQLANEKRELAARLEKLEQQFAKTEQEKPDFFDVDMDKINTYIQQTSDQIDEFKLEGNYLAAKKLELAQAKLLADLELNDQKRLAYLDRQGSNKTTETAQQAKLTTLDNAATFYRVNLKIEPAVWDKMGTWFAEQCHKDPILGAEFAEKVEKGAIGAIKWAHDYTVKNMGIKEKSAIDAKNKNKQTASGAAPKSGSGKTSTVDLSKALEKAKEAGTPEAWVEYQAAKRAATAR